MSLWGDIQHYGGQALDWTSGLNPMKAIPQAGYNLYNTDWSNPQGISHVADHLGPFGTFAGQAARGWMGAGGGSSSPFDFAGAIGDQALGHAAGALQQAQGQQSLMAQLANAQKAQGAPDRTELMLMQAMQQYNPQNALRPSSAIINKYLKASNDQYQSAIDQLHTDLGVSMKQNNAMSSNLARDLVVGGNTGRAVASQMQRQDAATAKSSLAETQAVDKKLQEQLGGGLTGLNDPTSGARAQVSAAQAAADANARLGGQADQALATEQSQWAKQDATEQNRALQRGTQRSVGNLDEQRASDAAKIQFQLMQQQQMAGNAFAKIQSGLYGKLADYEASKGQHSAQQQQNMLKLLIESQGRPQRTPLMDPKNPGGVLSDGANRAVYSPQYVQNPLSGILGEIMAQQYPSMGGALLGGQQGGGIPYIDPTSYFG